MNNELDKNWTITFVDYYSKKNGTQLDIDNTNRILKIKNSFGDVTAVVHFSANINHEVKEKELLNMNSNRKDKAYYVFENGNKGHDWLWHYGNLVSLSDLL